MSVIDKIIQDYKKKVQDYKKKEHDQKCHKLLKDMIKYNDIPYIKSNEIIMNIYIRCILHK